MSDENEAVESTNTAKLTTDGERFSAHIVLDVTSLDEDRRELLLGLALAVAGRTQFDVKCMEDADVKKALAIQRNRISGQGFAHE